MIIYTKNEFLKHCRKVKWGKITGPVTDAFWRNNLARSKKEQAGESGPKSTLVFYSLDDPKIDVEKTLNRNRNLWIVDHQGNPVNLPDIHCPLETSNSMVENDNIDFNLDDINLDEDPETNDQESDYSEYPVLWASGDWSDYKVNYEVIESTLAFHISKFEKGEANEMDVLSVLVESLSEYLQAFDDFKTGRKYQTNEIIADDDKICIHSKKLAIEYCKKLIAMFETEIDELKNETCA